MYSSVVSSSVAGNVLHLSMYLSIFRCCVIIIYSVRNDLELVFGLNEKRKQQGVLFLSLRSTLSLGFRPRPKIAFGCARVYVYYTRYKGQTDICITRFSFVAIRPPLSQTGISQSITERRFHLFYFITFAFW